MIRVVVQGAMGRMGQILVRLIRESSGLMIHAAVERRGHPRIGQSTEDVRIVDDINAALDGADVLVDFSAPEATLLAVDACARRTVAAVFGTTGLDAKQQAQLAQAAQRIPIVFAPNMSAGVNVTYRLVAEARRLLGDDFAPALFEAHHRWKKDAPSGTALKLAEAAGAPREAIMAIRGGDVVGEHTVFFLGDGERVEITHRATSRDAFARGALRAARWVIGRSPGLYEIAHVLGL